MLNKNDNHKKAEKLRPHKCKIPNIYILHVPGKAVSRRKSYVFRSVKLVFSYLRNMFTTLCNPLDLNRLSFFWQSWTRNKCVAWTPCEFVTSQYKTSWSLWRGSDVAFHRRVWSLTKSGTVSLAMSVCKIAYLLPVFIFANLLAFHNLVLQL